MEATGEQRTKRAITAEKFLKNPKSRKMAEYILNGLCEQGCGRSAEGTSFRCTECKRKHCEIQQRYLAKKKGERNLTSPPPPHTYLPTINDGDINDAAPSEKGTRTATVKVRLKQQQFSNKVRQVYEGRCAITGLTVNLEAAHIKPVSEGGSDHIGNGVLLHKGLHASFDTFLFTIDPEFLRIVRPRFMPERIRVPYEGWFLWSPYQEEHAASIDMLTWHNEAAKKFWAEYVKGATHAN